MIEISFIHTRYGTEEQKQEFQQGQRDMFRIKKDTFWKLPIYSKSLRAGGSQKWSEIVFNMTVCTYLLYTISAVCD